MGRALRAGPVGRSGVDQGLTRGDAGMAKVAGDFFVDVRRMKQGGGAVEERDEGKGQASVAVRGATKLRSELPFDEFEGWHVLFASEGDGPVFGDKAVIIGMGGEEIEGPTAGLRYGTRRPDGREKIETGAAAKEGEQIALVRKALVERGGSGASGAGNGAHGEGFFAAFAPDAIRGIEDATFQKSITLARHAVTLPVPVGAELYPLQR